MTDFQNPQHEPGSEKRMLLAFALTMIILLAMQPFISRYTKQQTPAPTATQPAATTPAQGEAKPAAPAPPSSATAKVAAAGCVAGGWKAAS